MSNTSKLLVVTGPSGVGKTYLAQELGRLYPNHFKAVKLFSTRKPRPNEQFIDRVFITEEEFAAKKKNKEFIFDGSFHGNRYGYPKGALKPTTKHVIVNSWPAFIPKFSTLPDVVLLGLTVQSQSLPLLQQRMRARGNTSAQIKERTILIQRDMHDLEQLRHIIEQHGKVFTIADNQTIGKSVIPWLEATLFLQPRP